MNVYIFFLFKMARHGFVFWTDDNNNRILRAGLDDAAPDILVGTGLQCPRMYTHIYVFNYEISRYPWIAGVLTIQAMPTT